MNRTKKLKLLMATCLLLWFATLAIPSQAQQTPDNPYIIVQVTDLSPASYGAIVKDLRQEASLNVFEACVPVELIVIEITSDMSNEASFVLAKQRIIASTDLEGVELKSMDVDAFRNTCVAARRGITN